MNILLSSVGRRPYLVRWFLEALEDSGVGGQVFVADSDQWAPVKGAGGRFVHAPKVITADYEPWLAWALEEHSIDLAVSVNDFELSKWASFSDHSRWKPLIRLSSELQTLVEDKFALSVNLSEYGVNAPRTWLGQEFDREVAGNGRFVTKGRYGSASRGLRYADGSNIEDAIRNATSEVTTRLGSPAHLQNEVTPESLLVVQEEIVGQEYGLDIVCDFSQRFAGVLARKKLLMRGGETDRAVTVDPKQFEDIAAALARAVPHRGTFDVDVIVDSSGRAFVIDVNPRFGGGYPFSHLAGANIPIAYILWALGRQSDEKWLYSKVGVAASKYVEVMRLGVGGNHDLS